MSAKRKRSSNYTPLETEKLLELVKQHSLAIEDKRTGAIYLARKKEAWEKVCAAYNAVATSGTRSVDQLRVLYDNTKQKARKALAEQNKSQYIQHHITEEEVKNAIQHVKVDKGQYNKTGGGSWHPAVTDHDLKILNILNDQVTPLPNSCDSAAVFYSVPGRPHKKKGVINHKLLYFKRKSQNALLERRRLYQEIRLRQKEHSLVLKEHQLRMQFLKEEHEKKMQEMP